MEIVLIDTYCNYLKECHGLNERPPETRKGTLIWKFAMSEEALIQVVCKNDKTRVFFSQIFFEDDDVDIEQKPFVTNKRFILCFIFFLVWKTIC